MSSAPLTDDLIARLNAWADPNGDSVARLFREAAEALAVAKQESDEEDQLRRRLSDILTRTANALKGAPKPLHSHSWHDLPEIAEAFAAASRDSRELLKAQRIIEIERRNYDRLKLCSDHRDKDGDYCIVCQAEKRTRDELAAAPRPPQEPITPYTPMLWVTLTDDQRYEEYIRVRQLVSAPPAAPPPWQPTRAENGVSIYSSRRALPSPPASAPQPTTTTNDEDSLTRVDREC